MSLADVLAVSRAARNIVLVGDPRQLAQPLQGSHPPGVGVSALDHLLGGDVTIASRPRSAPRPHLADASRRLRLHLAFVLWGRLGSEPQCARQAVIIQGSPPPVCGRHLSNTPATASLRCRGAARARRSRRTDERNLARRHRARASDDARGHRRRRPVQRAGRMPGRGAAGRREGGHCRSIPGTGGRGQHLLDGHVERRGSAPQPRVPLQPQPSQRGRVACPRASVLVCSPELLRARCHTPEQMRLVNALCRYVEMANPWSVVPLGAAMLPA